MKTFKKSLCLVLALVMVLGVCMVGASAAVTYETYADAESVAANEYADAINLVTDLGYMEGDEKGVFGAEDGLTRAQAAKLIAYVKLGADYAAQLGKLSASTGFEDVPASHWASGFISYCKNIGIINGYSATKFGPEDPVTGIQFAKMLLAANGYGAKDEYVGEGWDIAVWTDAMTNKLLISGLDTNAQVKRGEAAQFINNTLVNVKPATLSDGKYKYEKTFAEEKGITTAYAVVVANAATDGNLYGLTTVALYDTTTKLFEKNPEKFVVLAGIAGDETVIGHEFQITYKTGYCYVANDVTSTVSASDFKKDTTAKVAFQFNNFKLAESNDSASYLKYATGQYAKVSTDYKVGYISAYTAADASKQVLENISVVYGTNAADVATVYGSYSKEDIGSYVKLYQVGSVNKADVLETEVVTLTSKDAKGYYNGMKLAGATFQINTTDKTDEVALGKKAIAVMVQDGVYAAMLNYKEAEVDANEYVLVVCNYEKAAAKDDFGDPIGTATYFSQCVDAAGEIVTYQTLAAFDETGVYALGEEKDLLGNTYTKFVAPAAGKVVTFDSSAVADASKVKANSKYYYLSDANVYYAKDSKSALKVTAVALKDYRLTNAYAVVSATSNSNVYNVVTAWVTNATAVVPETTNVVGSYIYMTAADTKASSTVWDTETSAAVELFSFYQDGERMTDQKVDKDTIYGEGFYAYKIEKGIYKLDTNVGLYTNDVVVTLSKDAGFILNGKLTGDVFEEADISALKVVDLRVKPASEITNVEELAAAGVAGTVKIAVLYVAGIAYTPVGVIYVVG